MKKKEMQQRLETMLTVLPTQEDLKILDFDFSDVMTADQVLTQDERNKLIKLVRSARTTKATMRQVFTIVSAAIKVALLLK